MGVGVAVCSHELSAMERDDLLVRAKPAHTAITSSRGSSPSSHWDSDRTNVSVSPHWGLQCCDGGFVSRGDDACRAIALFRPSWTQAFHTDAPGRLRIGWEEQRGLGSLRSVIRSFHPRSNSMTWSRRDLNGISSREVALEE